MQTLIHADALIHLLTVPDASASLVCADPPYGIKFMGAQWDMGLPDPEIWAQCFRVLKPGAFLFSFMSARLDCSSEFAGHLKASGFDIGWTPMTWYYLNGLPKGKDLGKEADRLAGVERPVVGKRSLPGTQRTHFGSTAAAGGVGGLQGASRSTNITAPVTDDAKRLDGVYGGRACLKPAYELVVIAQKPCGRSPIVANALEHGVGGLCCDAARIPSDGVDQQTYRRKCESVDGLATNRAQVYGWAGSEKPRPNSYSSAGRFPATVIVTNQALGPDSRYFDVDRWATEKFGAARITELETGFAVGCAKASSAEKEAGLDHLEPALADPLAQHRGRRMADSPRPDGRPARMARNSHPTVKPLSLVAWLVSLGCPQGGLVVDPFAGTATSGVACALLGRPWLGIELDAGYCEIGRARLAHASDLPLQTPIRLSCPIQ